MSDAIHKHLLKAIAEYYPTFPMLMCRHSLHTFSALRKKKSDGDSVKHEEGPDGKEVKEKQAFLKLYGGQRSALTFLFKECEIIPWVQFQTKMIFPGSAQYSRFRSLLNNNILPPFAAAIQRLGIEPKDIGVHSRIRKGAATYYCCNGDGTTAGVAFHSVSVRAGLSMVV